MTTNYAKPEESKETSGLTEPQLQVKIEQAIEQVVKLQGKVKRRALRLFELLRQVKLKLQFQVEEFKEIEQAIEQVAEQQQEVKRRARRLKELQRQVDAECAKENGEEIPECDVCERSCRRVEEGGRFWDALCEKEECENEVCVDCTRNPCVINEYGGEPTWCARCYDKHLEECDECDKESYDDIGQGLEQAISFVTKQKKKLADATAHLLELVSQVKLKLEFQVEVERAKARVQAKARAQAKEKDDKKPPKGVRSFEGPARRGSGGNRRTPY